MDVKFKTVFENTLNILKTKLPSYLTYHSVEHTLYVLDRAAYIAKKENVTKHDLWLIKIAALYHDIGFIKTNIEHEIIGCEIAKKELKALNLSKEDIDAICGMIMATKIPQNPKNHLEEILADADLEYLATKHFMPVSELLYKELKHFNKNLTRDEWHNIQINFLEKHHYHTDYCKRYKAHRKNKNLENLKMQK